MRKNFPDNARKIGEAALIPELGRFPGKVNDNLSISCLENSMNREARWSIVHGVIKSQTQLSEHIEVAKSKRLKMDVKVMNG